MQSHLRSNEEELRREQQQRVTELQSQLTRNEQEIITLRQLIETQQQETGRYFSDHQPEISRDWVLN